MSDRPALFQRGAFTLHSGEQSGFKIECDSLTVEDWQTLAYMGADLIPPFGSVEGVPRGGILFAEFMREYQTEGPLLIVDDVCTTGASMEAQRAGRPALGLVAFSRGFVPDWVTPILAMIF